MPGDDSRSDAPGVPNGRASTVEYSVRRVDTEAEEEAVARFGQSSLDADDRRRQHRWYYHDNPGGEGALFALEATAAAGGREIAGGAGIGGRLFYFGESRLRAAAFVGLQVETEHRTLFPALRLVRTVREYARERFDFAYGFPNSLAEGVFRRAGSREIGALARYVRVLRSESYLSRRLGPSLATSLAGRLLDILAGSLEVARQARVPRHLALEWPASIDARFDRLWRDARGMHLLIGDRSADFLRWRFDRRPGGGVRIGALVRRESAEIRAYAAVLAMPGNLARLEDFLAASEAEFGMLLDLLLRQLRRQGFATVEAFFYGPKAVGAVLRSRGFRARGGNRVVVEYGRSLSLDPSTLVEPANWYLTKADDEPGPTIGVR